MKRSKSFSNSVRYFYQLKFGGQITIQNDSQIFVEMRHLFPQTLFPHPSFFLHQTYFLPGHLTDLLSSSFKFRTSCSIFRTVSPVQYLQKLQESICFTHRKNWICTLDGQIEFYVYQIILDLNSTYFSMQLLQLNG